MEAQRYQAADVWETSPLHVGAYAPPTQAARTETLQFSEDELPWADLPEWVRYAINLGFSWPDNSPRRTIAFVSMPCDSAASGLIALGAMIRRLQNPNFNDLSWHYGRLRALASSSSRHVLLRRRGGRKTFRFLRVDVDGSMWLERTDNGERHRVIDQYASDWHFDGEPEVEVTTGTPLTHADLYSALAPQSVSPASAALQRSDSSLCLAGRITGETATRDIMANVRFHFEANTVSLASLLPVHGWHSGRISRLAFFNTRRSDREYHGRLPDLVIADGAAATLRVIDAKQFARADVIGVVDRTAAGDQLEDLAQKVGSLRSWYTIQSEAQAGMPRPPIGVAMMRMTESGL